MTRLIQTGGRAIHRPGCRHLRNVVTREPITRETAEASAWWRRCRVCVPDFTERTPAPAGTRDPAGRWSNVTKPPRQI